MADLRFGALAPRLAEQITIREYSLRKRVGLLKHQQRDADAVTRLSVRGVLTFSQAQMARKKIVRQIERICQHFAERAK